MTSPILTVTQSMIIFLRYGTLEYTVRRDLSDTFRHIPVAEPDH